MYRCNVLDCMERGVGCSALLFRLSVEVVVVVCRAGVPETVAGTEPPVGSVVVATSLFLAVYVTPALGIAKVFCCGEFAVSAARAFECDAVKVFDGLAWWWWCWVVVKRLLCAQVLYVFELLDFVVDLCAGVEVVGPSYGPVWFEPVG